MHAAGKLFDSLQIAHKKGPVYGTELINPSKAAYSNIVSRKKRTYLASLELNFSHWRF